MNVENYKRAFVKASFRAFFQNDYSEQSFFKENYKVCFFFKKS